MAQFSLAGKRLHKLIYCFFLAYIWIFSQNSKNKLSFGINLHPEMAIFRTLNGSDVDALAGGTVTVNQLVNQVIESPYYSFPLDLGIICTAYNSPYEKAEILISSTLKSRICKKIYLIFSPDVPIIVLKILLSMVKCYLYFIIK